MLKNLNFLEFHVEHMVEKMICDKIVGLEKGEG